MTPTKTARAPTETWIEEAPLRLDGRDVAIARILRVAFATLELKRDLDPSLISDIGGLSDLLHASHRVIDELGFGDPERS
jgi:hypothetical protein